jgi:outer membrane protein assembly factor BamB
VNKILYLFIIFFLIASCSLNKNSKFWTASENVSYEKDINYEEVFPSEETLKKEFNSNLKIKLIPTKFNNTSTNNFLNNSNRVNFKSNLENSSRYKFSKIKNFNQYQPEISFFKNNLIFFDSKGSILKFDEYSKLIWKSNNYSKSEKKLSPILQLVNNGKYLIVADNITKYYMLDIETGNINWSKNNFAPFNSQIKIYKDKFFVIDFSNTLRCFSIKDGKELWNIPTENTLIRSQKKLSMLIIKDKLYFNNSIGDLTAVDIKKGELLWQLPTQSNLIYESAFSLQSSELISDGKNIFFSNNKNEFFSINISTGSVNWKNKINSNINSVLMDNLLISVSIEGYLVITDKNSGNIIRVTDIFQNFKTKKRSKIKPIGFIVGLNKIYLSTSNGKLLIIDIVTGKTTSTLKIANEKISKPFIQNNDLFLIKDNAIIRLN